MGALQINCFLDESEINKMVKEVEQFIYQFAENGISDYEGLFKNDTHVYVDFDTISLNGLKIKKIEVTDDEYEELYSDTAVLRDRLTQSIDSYNSMQESTISDGYSYREELARERYYNNKYTD